ncbi:hypothetical protein McpSp1_16940 [Methanocorpusculaceae archaeon Sp1]|nr:hypothetical protein [Methanocorpusculaceae archaeon Sp1]
MYLNTKKNLKNYFDKLLKIAIGDFSKRNFLCILIRKKNLKNYFDKLLKIAIGDFFYSRYSRFIFQKKNYSEQYVASFLIRLST